MADVRPFRGWRYAEEKVGPLADVVCPPYDVISPAEQRRLYERNPYNFIRLELAVERPGDPPLDNRYTRARQTFQEWRRGGVLRQEPSAVYYVYDQRFRYRGRTLTRRGLVAAVRLEPWSAGVVLPHEDTLAKPKADRLELMRTTAANFSPIISLYNDPQGAIREALTAATRGTPAIHLTDDSGEGHTIWVLADPALVVRVREALAARPLYIADGHHRYETALAYRDERAPDNPDAAANFVLMTLIDVDDPGVVIFPTHRVITGIAPTQIATLPDRLGEWFSVAARPAPNGDASAYLNQALDELEELGADRPAFGLLLRLDTELTWLTVVARDPAALERALPTDRSGAWRTLDVSVLHTLVLDRLLGIDEARLKAQANLTYVRDAGQAWQLVASGEAEAAAFLNPTRVTQVRDVAIAGDRMPQKSTYFYPKAASGLIVHGLEGEDR